MQLSGFSNVLLFIWIGFLWIWFGWTSIKIYRFYAQTRQQVAISRPQFHDTIKAIVKGTFFASLILIVPLAFVDELISSSNGFQLGSILSSWLYCLVPLVVFALLMLWTSLVTLKNMGYLWTDEEDIPIPEPPQPSPYADKSFEQLSKELDESLKQRTDKS